MQDVKNSPRKNIPHFKIFDYWKDKSITEDGRILVDNSTSMSSIFVIEFDYEPCCWGCGLPIITELEANQTEPLRPDDLPKIWGDKKVSGTLNRCHIRPRSLGGEDIPSNLFLMCETCHEESPDTTNARTFFRWVYQRRKSHSMGSLSIRSVYDLLDKEIKDRGLNSSPVDILKLILEKDPNFDWESFKGYLDKNVGQHGFGVNRTSLVSGYVDWLLHSFLEVSLR